jgi:hypothetical protein
LAVGGSFVLAGVDFWEAGVTIHSIHPDTHTHGLADECERCAEHAQHPIQSLDTVNLRRIMALAVDRDRLGQPATYTDQVAAGRVLTTLEHAGHLARTDPVLFAEFLSRYGLNIPLSVARQAKDDADAMFERAFGRKP